jgi:hypothetical protein
MNPRWKECYLGLPSDVPLQTSVLGVGRCAWHSRGRRWVSPIAATKKVGGHPADPSHPVAFGIQEWVPVEVSLDI